MQDINSVVLVGRLVRDIDLTYLQSGKAIGKISIAVNRSKKQNNEWINETSYFEVSLFGKIAENLKPYLVKGQQIAVVGSLKQDRWEKDGSNHSKVTILADNIQLLGNSNRGNNQNNNAGEVSYTVSDVEESEIEF